MNQEAILEVLKNVYDPSTGQNIVTLDMVQNIEIKGNQVFITLFSKNTEPEYRSDLNFAVLEAIKDAYPNMEVHTQLAAKSKTPVNNSPLPHVKNIIAVGSGKGGVGKSTISVNLAYSLVKQGYKVGLMDADLYGPSIPTMLGLKEERQKVIDIQGKPKMQPLEKDGLQIVSIGFIIEPEQAVVLRGPRLGGIIKQFIQDTIWSALDFLIIDLPPGTGDVQLTLVQTLPITGAVLVTTPQDVAVADAIRAMNMFLLPQVNIPILGVVENMAWFTPEELPNNKYFIFGEGGGKKLAKAANTILLGQVPLVQGVREGGDNGIPAVLQNYNPAAQEMEFAAKRLVEQTVIRNENLPPTRIIQVNS